MANSTCPNREKQLRKAHPSYIHYIRHCKRLNLSPGTLATKRCNLWTFHEWLVLQDIQSPLDVTSDNLEAFLLFLSDEYRHHGKRISKGSLSRYVGLLRKFYEFLLSEYLVFSSPALTLQHPRQAKRLPKDVLSKDEFKTFLNVLAYDSPSKFRDAVTIRLLMFSGMRLNELCKLDIDDCDLLHRELVLRDTKNKTDRIASIDKDTCGLLKQYLEIRTEMAAPDTSRLIINDAGNPITPTQVQNLVTKYLKKTRIRKHITPHSFRRTLCTLLLQAGLNIKVISEIVGHHKLSTTARYTEIDIDTLKNIYTQGHPLA